MGRWYWDWNELRESLPKDKYGLPKINWQKRPALDVRRRYGKACYLCGKQGADTVDHVIPRSLGGSDHLDNLRPAHRTCNSRKGVRLPEGWDSTPDSMWVGGKKRYFERLERQEANERAQERIDRRWQKVVDGTHRPPRSFPEKRRAKIDAAQQESIELDAWIEEQNRQLDEKNPDIPWSKGSRE